MIFNLQKHKQKIALITRQGEPISYEELVSRIEVFSSNLDREKSIVLCIVDNSPRLRCCIFIFLKFWCCSNFAKP